MRLPTKKTPFRPAWPPDPLQGRDADEAVDPGPPPLEAVATTDTGDAGFSDFYQASWDQIANGLAATIGDPALAAEATDEAMARAYERWGKVSGYDFPAGWVYRVGLNWARSYHRRLTRTRPLRPEEPVTLGAVADPSVRAALLDLPVKYRSVVVCRLLLDWSVDETADALHIAPGTVKSRCSRALAILGSTLGHMR